MSFKVVRRVDKSKRINVTCCGSKQARGKISGDDAVDVLIQFTLITCDGNVSWLI